MPNKAFQIRAERLPLAVDQSILKEVYTAKFPHKAAEIIAKHPCEDAVSIIDNLDVLTAAFMITMFQYCALSDGSLDFCTKEYAGLLIAKANELQIRGTLGLCHARDQVYRETGFFAGM